jgi:hypothetical protein
MCRDWNFESEADELEDLPDGEPRDCRAARRLKDYFRRWRDHHDADDDPFYDESFDQLCVGDVAIILDECRRPWRLEQQVLDALGPPFQAAIQDSANAIIDSYVMSIMYPLSLSTDC